MFALGYAFCLKVGEAICPQKSLNDFCLALGRVFNDALPDVQCQLLIKATPEASWKNLQTWRTTTPRSLCQPRRLPMKS